MYQGSWGPKGTAESGMLAEGVPNLPCASADEEEKDIKKHGEKEAAEGTAIESFGGLDGAAIRVRR